MSLLHLSTGEDLARVEPLVAAFHQHMGLESTDTQRRAALELLYSGQVHAALWLVGPRRSPVGYIAISFGFSIELGGRDAFIDEFYMRQAVRGRGMGTQVLEQLLPMLREMDIKALHLEVSPENGAARRIYQRARFKARSEHHLMTRLL